MNDPLQWIDAYLDGELSAEEAARLESWLAADPSRVDILVRQANVHWQLREALLREQTQGQALQMSSATPRKVTPPPPPRRRKPRRAILPWALSLTAVALAVCIAVVLVQLGNRHPDNVAQQTPQPSATPVATLTGVAQAVWEAGQTHRAGESLPAGRLQLRSGLAEIAFASGAMAIVEGPATLVITSPMAARLQRGKLTATVPPPAHGFRVDTPAASVVDLGTQFGLSVDMSGSVDVHVFTGQVDVGQAAQAHQVVRTGQAVRAEAGPGGKVFSINFLPASFAMSLKLPEPNPQAKPTPKPEPKPAAKADRRVMLVIAHEEFDATDYTAVRRELERAGAKVVVASTELTPATPDPQSGNEPVKPDVLLANAKAADLDAVVFVGGAGSMGTGLSGFMAHRPPAVQAERLIREMIASGKTVAAIHMAPVVFGDAGILDGKQSTGHKFIRKKLESHGAIWSEQPVVRDGLIVTGSDPATAEAFVRELLRPIQAGK